MLNSNSGWEIHNHTIWRQMTSFSTSDDPFHRFLCLVCDRFSAAPRVLASTSHHLRHSAVIFRCLLLKWHRLLLFSFHFSSAAAAAAGEPNSHQQPTGCFVYYIYHKEITLRFSQGPPPPTIEYTSKLLCSHGAQYLIRSRCYAVLRTPFHLLSLTHTQPGWLNCSFCFAGDSFAACLRQPEQYALTGLGDDLGSEGRMCKWVIIAWRRSRSFESC